MARLASMVRLRGQYSEIPSDVRYEADFRNLVPGAAVSLPGDLSFSRASAATVQVSQSAVVTSGITSNVARIGRLTDVDVPALVIEESRTNLVENGRDMFASGWFQQAIFHVSKNYAVGPDGALLAHRTILQANYTGMTAGGAVGGVGVQYTASLWVRNSAAPGYIVSPTDLSDANWKLTGATFSAGKLQETGVNDFHKAVQQPVSALASVTLTLTVRAKAVERDWLFLRLLGGGGGYAFFNVNTGVIGATSSCTPTIVPVGGGVYDCTIAVAGLTTPLAEVAVAFADSNNGPYVGTPGSGINIYNVSLSGPTDEYPRESQTLIGYNGVLANALGYTPTEWFRRAYGRTSDNATEVLIPLDSRDWTLYGGIAATPLDNITDMHQIEVGKFATEYIHTSGGTATRAGERLYLTDIDRIADRGRLSLEIRFRPKTKLSEYTTELPIWYVDANNQAYFTLGGLLVVKIAGVAYTASTSLPLSVNKAIDFWLECGGNELPTRADYQNIDLAENVTLLQTNPSQIQGNVPTGSVDLFCRGTSVQFSAWIEYIRSYKRGTRPSWIVV